MESALLNLDIDSCVNVPVCNYNMNAQPLSKRQMVGRLYQATLTNYDSDVVSEGTSEVVKVRTFSTTKSSSDENHWEKLHKVLRISDGIPDTKHNPFKSEISKFYGMLKPYANAFISI